MTFLEELTEKLKEKNAASLQPAEKNLLHIENIFKDTVDLRECPRDSCGWLSSKTWLGKYYVKGKVDEQKPS